MADEIFDCELRQDTAKVKYDNAVHDIVIREMTGDFEEEYLDGDKDNIQLDIGENGKVKAKLLNVKGVHKALLAKMLYENNAPVPIEVIAKWPMRVQRALYVKAQAVMGYSTKPKDKADELKNG